MVRPLKLKFNDARNHAFQRIHIHPNDVSNIIKRQTEYGSYQYRYDHLDRLSQAEIARYSYDPFGRRIRKTVSQSGGQNGTSTPLGTTTYLYADEGLLAEADMIGNITTTYGWIPNGIWGTAPQWKADVTMGSNTTPATLTYHYFHNDHLGSSQRLTNDQGVLTWSARMEAFGKTTTIDSIITNLVNGQSQTALMPTTTVNNLRFPGQFEDQETGTSYNWNRDYDPAIGRYLQIDPIGFAGGMNRYAYVRGRPSHFSDPEGEFLILTALAGGVFGLVGNLAYQLYQNNGQCVNWKNAGVAFGVGLVAGATLGLAAGSSFIVAGGIGSGANVVQYGLTQLVNGEPINKYDAGINVLTGFAGGALGGAVKLVSPFSTTGYGSNAAIASALNSDATVAAQAGVGSAARNLSGSVTSNIDLSGGTTCK